MRSLLRSTNHTKQHEATRSNTNFLSDSSLGHLTHHKLKSQISNFRSQISDLKSQKLKSQISDLKMVPGKPRLPFWNFRNHRRKPLITRRLEHYESPQLLLPNELNAGVPHLLQVY